MHIHILGICGTFMGGLAILARQLGYRVTGSDANVYPPMSTQLEQAGIELMEGYHAAHLEPVPDLVVIGNALSRGNPAIEHVLANGLAYMSGPEFLSHHVLHGRWVLAVAGTHGKTTTSTMLAWILEYAGLSPGFLIGGVPLDFGLSARLGEAPFFVVEADEYDTAFFDKRSKFVHYRPRTLVMNNLEYDHADIFSDIAAIKQQFHHLVRIVPGNGLIITPAADANLNDVLAKGCWTPVERFLAPGGDITPGAWRVDNFTPDGGAFDVCLGNDRLGRVNWPLTGHHNMENALAAIAAARHAGVAPKHAIDALSHFRGVKRRMEERGNVDGITIYDDFAHHPTAIAKTLDGLRKRVDGARIVAVLEPRSNTMRLGVHKHTLAPSLNAADRVLLFQPPDLGWPLDSIARELGDKGQVFETVPAIVDHIKAIARPGDHILIMSNGAFGGIHDLLITALEKR
ncbi:MAG: UDP-N-acetylmuramate:L-alanyl-gamma-D-glutamyl-meso-diaminopimelate ligase [Gammaproteobacteria bacterium]|nr:MAG: UDP-N-acetylmuramate:L-alanyl-gamma-D-glutamyl-meso-diaminopimelate ligase [Gammaproteobacteria bacterium]TND03998.1 MAG: UDP-N-acetylmuramate:L-alanyl-gamma-D-glutamyl-meso-diaminopimelate ligase [Gammaproteobacteria bacterium]